MHAKYSEVSFSAIILSCQCVISIWLNKSTQLFVLRAGIKKVPFDTYGPAIEGLFRGDCQAAFVGKAEYQTFIRGNMETFKVCNDPNVG
jgi:hypothetical protein